MKYCNLCKEEKPLSDYYVRNSGKLVSNCRKCHQIRRHQNRIMKQYGLDLESYSIQLNKQNGKCKICNRLPKAGNKYNENLTIDHCHKTGKVRGLLCSRCNSGLGYFADNSELLKKAIKYLNEYSF